MVRRLVPFLFSLPIALATLAVPASADDAVAPSFTVPDAPAGDITVTATAPVDTAPYLRVRLTAWAATPVVANDGPDTAIPVETWGLSGAATFTLQGCATDAATTCTNLVSVSRTVTQTAALTATIDAPSDFFYWPESPVTVTAHNDGGGSVHAFAGTSPGARMDQVIDQDVPSDLDLTGVVTGNASAALATVKRCSSYEATLCEPAVVSQRLNFLGTVETYVIPPTGAAVPVATDPALRHHSITYGDHGPAIKDMSFTATWTIEDADGATVIGPVDAGSGMGLSTLYVTVDPSAQPGGEMLDGNYTLRVRNTVQTPSGEHTGDWTTPIALVSDPAPEAAPTPTVVDDSVRIGPTGWGLPTDDAQFSVPVIDGTATGPLTLTVRNSAGTVVDARTYSAKSNGSPLTTYSASWDGWRMTGGSPLPAGVYSAWLSIPDHYGRPVVVPLGTIDDYGYTGTSRSVTKTVSARLHTPRRGTTSRIFRVRLPADIGNVFDIYPAVRAASPTPLGGYSVALRVPSLRRAWTAVQEEPARRRARWSNGRDWLNLGDGVRPSLAGRVVEVRVAVHDGWSPRVDVSGVRLHVHGWRWSLS